MEPYGDVVGDDEPEETEEELWNDGGWPDGFPRIRFGVRQYRFRPIEVGGTVELRFAPRTLRRLVRVSETPRRLDQRQYHYDRSDVEQNYYRTQRSLNPLFVADHDADIMINASGHGQPHSGFEDRYVDDPVAVLRPYQWSALLRANWMPTSIDRFNPLRSSNFYLYENVYNWISNREQDGGFYPGPNSHLLRAFNEARGRRDPAFRHRLRNYVRQLQEEVGMHGYRTPSGRVVRMDISAFRFDPGFDDFASWPDQYRVGTGHALTNRRSFVTGLLSRLRARRRLAAHRALYRSERGLSRASAIKRFRM
jgi:hypothetical protein